MRVTSMRLKLFISACDCCRFLVIERCGNVQKLVVIRNCTPMIALFYFGILVFFLILGIRRLCLSNLTTPFPGQMS